jgi:hypothetical protein
MRCHIVSVQRRLLCGVGLNSPPLFHGLGQALLHLAAYLLHGLAPCPRHLPYASLMQQAPVRCDQRLELRPLLVGKEPMRLAVDERRHPSAIRRSEDAQVRLAVVIGGAGVDSEEVVEPYAKDGGGRAGDLQVRALDRGRFARYDGDPSSTMHQDYPQPRASGW